MATTIDDQQGGINRRDFIYIGTAAFAAIGAAAAMWPLIDQLNPDASTLSLASIEVDLAPSPAGPGHHRSVARQADLHQKPDARGDREGEGGGRQGAERPGRRGHGTAGLPATDANRTKPGKENWLVMIGICTHLGCIPKGQSAGDEKGPLWRLVLPVPWLGCTIRQGASARDRRRAIWISRPTGSSTDTKIKIG